MWIFRGPVTNSSRWPPPSSFRSRSSEPALMSATVSAPEGTKLPLTFADDCAIDGAWPTPGPLGAKTRRFFPDARWVSRPRRSYCWALTFSSSALIRASWLVLGSGVPPRLPRTMFSNSSILCSWLSIREERSLPHPARVKTSRQHPARFFIEACLRNKSGKWSR